MNFNRRTSRMKDLYVWRILLVDDDEDDYVLVRQMLSDAREGSFTLEWAPSFDAGLQILESDQTFDAVIVDYDMGAHTGIEIIRAVAPYYPAPILLLTGRGTYEVDIEAMEAGAADFLSKGEINAVFLERAIRYAIDRKKGELALRTSQTALRESKDRYQDLFRTMLNGFALHEMVFDSDGNPIDYRFLEINQAFEHLTGLQAAQVVGKTVREIFPDLDAVWIEVYGKVVTTGEAIQFENYATPLARHYQVYAFRPRENQFATVFSDVTARVETERALRESEQRERSRAKELEALMDAVPAIIWISRDAACKDMFGNRYGYQFLGVEGSNNISKTAPAGAVTQQPYRNFKNGVEIPAHELPMQVAAATGQAARGYEFDIVFEDGSVYNLFGNVEPLFDDQGKADGAVAAFVDLTERKQIEKTLQETLQRSALMARFPEENPNPVMRVSLDGQVLYCNPAGQKVFSEGMDVGDKVSRLLMPAIERAIARGHEIRENIALGERIYVFSLMPYPQEKYVNLYARDETEQRRIEARHREYVTKMEVQYRLLEQREMERQQIARVLHDGPLQDVIGLMYGMQYVQDQSADSEITTKLDQLGDDAKKLVVKLRNLCFELRPPSVSHFGLSKSIQSYAEGFQSAYPIQVQLNLAEADCELPDTINLAIYRIFQEALRNIHLHANANLVKIDLFSEKSQLVLRITDNGSGFVLPENWVEFARQDRFGFVSMNERAEAIGGTLQVFSSPNQGTTIELKVPCEKLPE